MSVFKDAVLHEAAHKGLSMLLYSLQIPGQFMTYFHKRGIIPKTFSSELVQQSKAHIARARSNEP